MNEKTIKSLGVDVHKDGLLCRILKIKAGKKKIRVIDSKFINGATDNDMVWKRLEKHIFEKNPHVTVIDSGFCSKRVYDFCKDRKNVYAAKGISTSSDSKTLTTVNSDTQFQICVSEIKKSFTSHADFEIEDVDAFAIAGAIINTKTRRDFVPLPQRYINKHDEATLKTIEIIGRKKYKQLLDAGIIMVDYEMQKENRARHTEHVIDLNTTVRTLSNMIGSSALLHEDLLP